MLHDVLSQTDFVTAPSVALLIFFAVFVGISVWTLGRRRETHFEHLLTLPFEDGTKEDPDE